MKFKKQRGQNFLIDKNLIAYIIRQIPKLSYIWEIGGGYGALTKELLQRDSLKKYVVFEIEKDYIKRLKELENEKEFEIIEGDFLKNYNKIHKPDIIIGNLPYSISSKIILSLIDLKVDAIFLLQKEFIDRLKASINNKNYSALSVITQSFYDIKINRIVNNKVFYPVPNILSALVEFKNKEDINIIDTQVYKDFIQKCFCFKRKVLIKKLKDYSKIENIFLKLSIELNSRAEDINPLQYKKLFNEIYLININKTNIENKVNNTIK